MTGADAYRLREIRMGDTITWPDGSGVVVGWRDLTGERYKGRYVLVEGLPYQRDIPVPLSEVIERRRPGRDSVRFK
jgi:hypothetical protein